MTRTETIDTLYATTWALSKSESVQQVFKKTQLLTFLASKKKVEPRGGRELRFPVLIGRNNTTTWFGADGELATEGSDPTRMVWYDWKYSGTTVKQVFTHAHQNSGKAQIRDMVKDDIEVARLSISQAFEEVLNGDGTTPNAPNGLKNLVSITPTEALTVGGWDQATYAWWRNPVITMTGTAADNLSKQLRRLYRQCSNYGPAPNVCITDGTTYDLFEDTLEEKHLFMDDKMKDLGWPNVPVVRGMPVLWSNEAQSGGYIRMLNTNDIYVFYDQGLWMEMGEWMRGISNVNRVAHILSALNMVARRRVSSGVLAGVTS
jgi:hypothetical protein